MLVALRDSAVLLATTGALREWSDSQPERHRTSCSEPVTFTSPPCSGSPMRSWRRRTFLPRTEGRDDGHGRISARKFALTRLGDAAGLRRGEIAALCWEDIDVAHMVIRVRRSLWKGEEGPPKHGKNHSVPLTRRTAAALLALQPTTPAAPRCAAGRIFGTEGSKPITETTINEWMVPVHRKAGMKFSRKVHVLRHSFCSPAVMAGVPVRTIQAYAGHADLTTTMRYLHRSPDAREEGIRGLEQFRSKRERGAGEEQPKGGQEKTKVS